MEQQQAPNGRAGWPLNRWCEDSGITRDQFNKLPPDLKPSSKRVRRSVIITESPAEWLARVGK